MSKNLSSLSGRKGLENNLFDRYGQLTIASGSPDKESLEELAEEFLMGPANTYGATTFYDFLKPENQHKKVYVCNGSVCTCAGTQPMVREALRSHFDDSEIGEMCCLGRCHENAAFHFRGTNYSGASPADIDRIIKEQPAGYDEYAVVCAGPEILTGHDLSITEVVHQIERLLSRSPEEIQQEVLASNLRGRGGAGFPIGRKLSACAQQSSDVRFIICNADEGDPGAFSDRYLLEQQPLKLLLGMMIAGYAAGAQWGVLYIRAEYPESVRCIEKSIAAIKEQGLVGSPLFSSKFSFNFKVIKAQGAYICGEESALINSIEGQRPEVRIRPPYPVEQGLFLKPTVVNNVETLAALPYILEQGGDTYASIGTPGSTGTKLLSLDSYFHQPGIYEVPMGFSLKEVIYDLAGGFRKPVKALHIGGPLGGLIPVNKIDALDISFESFRTQGFLLGHASIICIPEEMPILQYLQHLLTFAAHESCGKCFPCRLGTKRGAELMQEALQSDYKMDRALLEDLLHTLETGSLCAHGGGIPLPVRNALEHFASELAPYFKQTDTNKT